VSADNNPQLARNSEKRVVVIPLRIFCGISIRQACLKVGPLRPKNNTTNLAVSEPVFSRANFSPKRPIAPPALPPLPSNPV